MFRDRAPDIDFRIWPDAGDPSEIRYLACWKPLDDMMSRFPNLELLFSTGAGVDQFNLAEIPDSVQVARLIDPAIVAGMREYVSYAVLALHRDMPDYRIAQSERSWRPLKSRAAADTRVGIMGLGVIGRAAVEVLRPFGYRLSGWSRSRKDIPGVECFAGSDQLIEFASSCNILVCLLPLTEKTRGILNAELFGAMPQGAGLVNVGRGEHLRERDLVAALDDGQLSGAIIDVLEDEPARQSHPFWAHPRIKLTPHIASQTGYDSAANVLLDDILRHRRGERIPGIMDKVSGY